MTTLQELRNQKRKLLVEFNLLALEKKRKYSNMDIESPMSTEEKKLNKLVSRKGSELNQVVKLINKEIKVNR